MNATISFEKFPATAGRLDRPSPPPRAFRSVADLVLTSAVTLPAWFEARRAAQVAGLKRTRYVMVEERGQIAGVAMVEALAGAAAGQLLSRFMLPSSIAVSADASAAAALAVMQARGLDCIPVTCGSVVVGVVTLEALLTPLGSPTTSLDQLEAA